MLERDVRNMSVWMICVALILMFRYQLVEIAGTAGMFSICLTLGITGIGTAIDLSKHSD